MAIGKSVIRAKVHKFNILSSHFNAKPVSAYTIRSSPQKRPSDNKVVPRGPVWNKRCDHRMLCHFSLCHLGKRRDGPWRSIDLDWPAR
jgi:hypothetical protein